MVSSAFEGLVASVEQLNIQRARLRDVKEANAILEEVVQQRNEWVIINAGNYTEK